MTGGVVSRSSEDVVDPIPFAFTDRNYDFFLIDLLVEIAIGDLLWPMDAQDFPEAFVLEDLQ